MICELYLVVDGYGAEALCPSDFGVEVFLVVSPGCGRVSRQCIGVTWVHEALSRLGATAVRIRRLLELPEDPASGQNAVAITTPNCCLIGT